MYDESGQCVAFPHKILWSTENGECKHIFNLILLRKAFQYNSHRLHIKLGEITAQNESPNNNNNNNNNNIVKIVYVSLKPFSYYCLEMKILHYPM